MAGTTISEEHTPVASVSSAALAAGTIITKYDDSRTIGPLREGLFVFPVLRPLPVNLFDTSPAYLDGKALASPACGPCGCTVLCGRQRILVGAGGKGDVDISSIS